MKEAGQLARGEERRESRSMSRDRRWREAKPITSQFKASALSLLQYCRVPTPPYGKEKAI